MARKKKEGTLRERLGVPETPEGAQEPPKALVPKPRLTVAGRVTAARDALAATREGMADAREIAIALRPVWPQELLDKAQKDEEGATGTAVIIVMSAVELGISPLQAFSYITSIRGKPFLMSRMISAMIGSRVPGGYITITERTAQRATGIGHRPGRPDVKLSITMQDAIKAKWSERNPNYKTNPAAMLVSRVISTIGWIQFSDILSGMDAYNDQAGEEMYAQDSEFANVTVLEGTPDEAAVNRSAIAEKIALSPEQAERQAEAAQEAQEAEEQPVEAEYRDLEDDDAQLPEEEAEEAPAPIETEDDIYAKAFLVLGRVVVDLGLEKPLNSGHINTALRLQQTNQKGLRAALFKWTNDVGDEWEEELYQALITRYGKA